jgi:hypothetical protein
MLKLSRGSCPSNLANDVRQKRLRVVGGIGLRWAGRVSPEGTRGVKGISSARAGFSTGTLWYGSELHLTHLAHVLSVGARA